MLCALKKTLGVCLIGLGLGILLVLLLPNIRLAIYYWTCDCNCWFNVVILLKRRVNNK